MSLAKKMILGVLTLILVLLIVTYTITVKNSRDFFIEQMRSNAQDTATSLGLSLSNALIEKDRALMLAMVEAVFDRGFFAKIAVTDMQGQAIISRIAPARKTNIPLWFANWMKWRDSTQSAVVMNGWNQAGRVLVTSDHSYATAAIWQNAVELFYWYLSAAIVASLLTVIFIRWLMQPLQRVTKQAIAICNHEFKIEEKLPRTPELQKMTVAMNQMVSHVKRLFQDQLQQAETLRQQAFQDSLTGLGNRRFFLQQLTALVSNTEEFSPGYVLFVAIDGLKELNEGSGYVEGDHIIELVAKSCKNFWGDSPGRSITRISGSNFGIIIREENKHHFLNACDEFNQTLQQLYQSNFPCNIHMAAAPYQLNESITELLTEVDLALKKARLVETRFAYSPLIDEMNTIALDKEFLNQAIDNEKVAIYSQKITNGSENLHQELFLRVITSENEISAGRFVPAAEKFHLADKVDTLVLKILKQLDLLKDHPICINLTETTMINQNFRDKYIQQLALIPPESRSHLSLEFREEIVLNHFEEVSVFVKMIRALGIQVGIDQVGTHFSPMHYLNQLPINYLKLHGSLIYDIEENQNKQFFIHYFNEMANILNISVVATQIETESQWLILKDLSIKWGQGKYLGSLHALYHPNEA